jgi:hypothetical protein
MQRLADVLPAASELAWLNVSDSLEILTLMALAGDQRFDKAAVRWIIGRLLVETPPMVADERVEEPRRQRVVTSTSLDRGSPQRCALELDPVRWTQLRGAPVVPGPFGRARIAPSRTS